MPKVCFWYKDKLEEFWTTDCGAIFHVDSGIDFNKIYNTCPYCLRKIERKERKDKSFQTPDDKGEYHE